jgi:hypothetical protein
MGREHHRRINTGALALQLHHNRRESSEDKAGQYGTHRLARKKEIGEEQKRRAAQKHPQTGVQHQLYRDR